MSSDIRFEPAGVEGLMARGTTLAAAAERLGVRIELTCGGQGACTSCAVVVAENPLSLSPLTESEERLLTAEQVASSARLACQARLGEGDCVVRVPPQAEAATGEAAEGETPADARERIRESFTELPVGEQFATVLEMQLKLAEGLLDAVVEGPLKAGQEFVASIFGGSSAGEADKAGDEPGPSDADGEPGRGEESKRDE
jgi:ferredoxin, 2Fe-2S